MTLPKVQKFFDLTIVGLGSSLGIGVFVLLGELSKLVVGPAVVVSIVTAGAIATLAGLCFAEFTAWYLRIDTPYLFSYSCYGENVAFTFGWALMLQYIAGTAGVVKGAIAFIDALSENQISDFLVKLAPINLKYFSSYFDFISSIIVVTQMFLIAIGLKDWMRLKYIFVIGNVILLCISIILGAFKASPSNWSIKKNEDEMIEGGFAPFGFLGIVKGTAIVFFGFIGFERIGISGKEVKNQYFNIPLAVLATTFMTTMVLLGVGVILTLMRPYYALNTYAPLPFAFEQVQWSACKWLVAVGACMSFQTSFFGITFPLPRVIYAMANDGLLLHCVGKNYFKTNTPLMAITGGGTLAAIAAGIFTFQQLVYLTVITTLFVCTLIAANVIILRSKSSRDDEEKLSESINTIAENKRVSFKTILRQSFSSSANPTYITEKIILGNIILFCFSSISLSVIFIIFKEPLINLSAGVIFSVLIFSSLMTLSMVSMMCQIKPRNDLHFRVPFVPFLPCISIFLNIFLMVSFELVTWIQFLMWIVLGIILHYIRFFFKCNKHEVDKNSLYDINKMNTLKLSESIWKIKSQKNLFYEGAVNHAFKDNLEETLYEAQNKFEGAKRSCEMKNSSLELKQAEVIQLADLILEEQTEPLKCNTNLNWEQTKDISNENVRKKKTEEHLPPQGDKVYKKCLAEIHSEKELSQEIIALEIVDNTYNFLSEEVEELPQNDTVSSGIFSVDSSEQEFKENIQNKEISDEEKQEKLMQNLPLKPYLLPDVVKDTQKVNESSQSFSCLQLREELLNELCERKNNIKKDDQDSKKSNEFKSVGSRTLNLDSADLKKFIEKAESSLSNNIFYSLPSKLNSTEDYKHIVNFIVKTSHEDQSHQKRYRDQNEHSEESKEKQEEQNKVIEFKKKLNNILKSQINFSATYTKNLIVSKYSNGHFKEADNLTNKEKNEETEHQNIKTLNKSQIRNKLEHLLSKGPPKRLSLRDSFIIKDNNTDLENSENRSLKNINIINGSNGVVIPKEVLNECNVDQTNKDTH